MTSNYKMQNKHTKKNIQQKNKKVEKIKIGELKVTSC